jgi:hypothetical protein
MVWCLVKHRDKFTFMLKAKWPIPFTLYWYNFLNRCSQCFILIVPYSISFKKLLEHNKLLTGESDGHGAMGVDRVPTGNTDCRSMKSEPASSLEENKSKKKRDLATEGPDISACCVEVSAGVRHCLCLNVLSFLHIRTINYVSESSSCHSCFVFGGLRFMSWPRLKPPWQDFHGFAQSLQACHYFRET